MPGAAAESRAWLADSLPRALPFALYIGFLALAPLLAPHVADARWLYAVQIGLVAAALGFYWRRYVELPSPLTTGWKNLGLAAAMGFGVFIAWINLELPWLAWAQGNGFNPSQPDGSLNMALVVLRIAGAAIVIPVMEELFWRSMVLRWFDRSEFLGLPARAVSNSALLYCAIPFGLEHNLWFAGILAGLAYGWLYRHTGNLWVPVFSHSVTNLLLGLWVVSTGHWRFW